MTDSLGWMKGEVLRQFTRLFWYKLVGLAVAWIIVVAITGVVLF